MITEQRETNLRNNQQIENTRITDIIVKKQTLAAEGLNRMGNDHGYL